MREWNMIKNRVCIILHGFLLAIVLVSLLVSIFPISTAGADTIVNFPDPGLQQAIRQAIGKPTGDIYQSDLGNLTSLNAEDKGISDLSGLEHCTSLTYLSLYSNQIGNISLLSSLTNLTWLSLYSNQIGNISPLVNNPGLATGDSVYLYNNPLSSDSIYTYIPQLQGRGVQVYYDVPAGSTPVTGITREVNGNILPGVSITLDGIGPVLSDQDGYYEIMATATGNYTVTAHKVGFRNRTQTINITGLGTGYAVTCNFQGNYGLIPNAPDMWYALDCVNHWLYPPNPDIGLTMWTALDVINAWLYPVQ